MQNIPILLDIHTHSLASGHGSRDTITDMARAAADASLEILGISDHGPATPGSGSSSYFRNLRLADRRLYGINLLYGVELNILNENGDVDLDDELIGTLDYALVSMHPDTFRSGNAVSNTQAFINAMRHPHVHFLGHPDDGRFPVDYERLLFAAKEHHVFPELNNSSLMPQAFRKDGLRNSATILTICKSLQLPVLLSSDSHGKSHLGDMRYILPLLEQCNFPQELIINSDPALLCRILGKSFTKQTEHIDRSICPDTV